MDTGKLIYLFRMTIDPNQRNEAEKQLAEVRFLTPGHVARDSILQFLKIFS